MHFIILENYNISVIDSRGHIFASSVFVFVYVDLGQEIQGLVILWDEL